MPAELTVPGKMRNLERALPLTVVAKGLLIEEEKRSYQCLHPHHLPKHN
jgi:hypothetical protein